MNVTSFTTHNTKTGERLYTVRYRIRHAEMFRFAGELTEKIRLWPADEPIRNIEDGT
jgi:hypothetical protein